MTPPLGSAPLEYKTAALGLHSGAKSELSSSADLAGLVSSLHFPGSLSSMGDGGSLLVSFKKGETPIDSIILLCDYINSMPLRQ